MGAEKASVQITSPNFKRLLRLSCAHAKFCARVPPHGFACAHKNLSNHLELELCFAQVPASYPCTTPSNGQLFKVLLEAEIIQIQYVSRLCHLHGTGRSAAPILILNLEHLSFYT